MQTSYKEQSRPRPAKGGEKEESMILGYAFRYEKTRKDGTTDRGTYANEDREKVETERRRKQKNGYKVEAVQQAQW